MSGSPKGLETEGWYPLEHATASRQNMAVLLFNSCKYVYNSMCPFFGNMFI